MAGLVVGLMALHIRGKWPNQRRHCATGGVIVLGTPIG
jgi:hypothetical protein